MKTYLAVFIGKPETVQNAWADLNDAQRKDRQQTGIAAWKNWIEKNKYAIIDMGTPLGKTKQVSPAGIADIKNALTGYTLVRAASHEDAAKLFEGHPHFSIFPGDSIEIMECLPIPSA